MIFPQVPRAEVIHSRKKRTSQSDDAPGATAAVIMEPAEQ
jgi:hypothetical protein